MTFNELSNAVFRFALKCAGAEIEGGQSPQQVVGNPEA